MIRRSGTITNGAPIEPERLAPNLSLYWTGCSRYGALRSCETTLPDPPNNSTMTRKES